MLIKRMTILALIMVLLSNLFFFPANAEDSTPLTREAADLCLDIGRRGCIFPDGTTYEDLIVETYTISALGEPYTVWVVSTAKQRSDVEFGWISLHAPTNTVLQSSRTRKSYEEAIHLLEWEQVYGCSYFWPAALKAQYYHELRGDDSRITYLNENEITEAEAIAIARQTLMADLGLQNSELDQLPISVEFYQDNTPNDSVQSERYWGITFRENNGSFRFMPLYAVVIDGLSGIPEYSIDYQKNLIIEHAK